MKGADFGSGLLPPEFPGPLGAEVGWGYSPEGLPLCRVVPHDPHLHGFRQPSLTIPIDELEVCWLPSVNIWGTHPSAYECLCPHSITSIFLQCFTDQVFLKKILSIYDPYNWLLQFMLWECFCAMVRLNDGFYLVLNGFICIRVVVWVAWRTLKGCIKVFSLADAPCDVLSPRWSWTRSPKLSGRQLQSRCGMCSSACTPRAHRQVAD